MKRKFEALSWSGWNWQRPFSEEDVKSLLGQLVIGAGSPPRPQPKDLPNLSAKWYQVITNNILSFPKIPKS